MKATTSVSSILLISFIVVLVQLNEAHYYGPLIKDVTKKYKITGVIIVPGASYPSFEQIRIWYKAVRMLSNEGISTRILKSGQLNVHEERAHRMLLVIILNKVEDLHFFGAVTKYVPTNYAVWLIVSAKDASRDVCDFCRNPQDRLLDLETVSKVLVLCCDSNMIEEWSDIKENRTKRQKVGRLWNENGVIGPFSDDLVPGRKRSLEGQVLRIAAVKNSVYFWMKDGDYYGITGEILKELSLAANFTIPEILWQNSTGFWDPKTSSWTGLIGKVHRGEADMGVQLVHFSSERYKVVSFTSPVITGAFKLHYRKYNVPRVVWNTHFQVL